MPAGSHSLYTSATVVVGLMQMVRLTQTSYFWIIRISLKSEIQNWQNHYSVQSKTATGLILTNIIIFYYPTK